jgi:hypothetical protein
MGGSHHVGQIEENSLSKIVRTSAWADDAGMVNVEVVWYDNAGVRYTTRLLMDDGQADSFKMRLEIASQQARAMRGQQQPA